MCGYDDAERCSVFDETERKSRKAHTCDECRKPIPVATKYMRIKSLFDGSWSTAAIHLECWRAREELDFGICKNRLVIVEGPDGQGIIADLKEHAEEHPEAKRLLETLMEQLVKYEVVSG